MIQVRVGLAITLLGALSLAGCRKVPSTMKAAPPAPFAAQLVDSISEPAAEHRDPITLPPRRSTLKFRASS